MARKKNKGDSFEVLFKKHAKWAEKKFPKSTWMSSLKGLKREIKECIKAGRNPCLSSDKEWGLEFVDCFMYLLDSMRRAGFTLDELKTLFSIKLIINKKRKWKKNRDGSYSHKKNNTQKKQL